MSIHTHNPSLGSFAISGYTAYFYQCAVGVTWNLIDETIKYPCRIATGYAVSLEAAEYAALQATKIALQVQLDKVTAALMVAKSFGE